MALAPGSTPPRQNPPFFAHIAICEPLRGIFSLGLAVFPREGLDGWEGLGWET
jgi:hypothetical protein